MPVNFVSVHYMQRKLAHLVRQRLAYISRQELLLELTGERFDYSERGDIAGPVKTLLPAGAPPEFEDASVLWEAVDAAAKHKLASLGIDLVIALPGLDELDALRTRVLLEQFLSETVVSHDLGATYAIHLPHASANDTELRDDLLLGAEEADPFGEAMAAARLNRHAHVLVTPRRIGPKGLDRLRYTALDPKFQGLVQKDELEWYRLWTSFQNRFFAAQGLELRVRPVAPMAVPRAPLAAVRRWRQRRREIHPHFAGRDLLIDPVIEAANRDLLQTPEAALEQIEGPFVRQDLVALFERHLLDRHEATEMASAAIGLGDVISLGDGSGAGSRWLVAADDIACELTVFGRAAVLGRRVRRGPEPDLSEGFSAATRDFLRAVAAGPDLVVIDAYDRVPILVGELALLAKLLGRLPASISHGVASAHPAATAIYGVETLIERTVYDALIIVDVADALGAAELGLLVETAVAGDSQLVLVCRPTGPWPRSELLDLIATRALRLQWGTPDSQQPLTELFWRGELMAAIEVLAAAGHIVARADGKALELAVVEAAGRRLGAGEEVMILAADAGRREQFAVHLAAAGVAAAVTDVLPTGFAGAVLAIVEPHAATGRMLAAQLARAEDLTLFIDSEQTPSAADLLAQLRIDSPLTAAIAGGVAGRMSSVPAAPEEGQARLPRFATLPDGEVVVEPDAVLDAVAFWSSAPWVVSWARAERITPEMVQAALRPVPAPDREPDEELADSIHHLADTEADPAAGFELDDDPGAEDDISPTELEEEAEGVGWDDEPGPEDVDPDDDPDLDSEL